MRGRLALATRVVLAALAALALRRQLHGLRATDLLAGLRSYGWRHVAVGLACTAASFLLLGAFEVMALRYDGGAPARAVPPRAAFATAFVASAFSQSIGVALLTGAAVRLRAYARFGVDAAAVARVSAFVTATATLGLLATGAVALAATAAPVRVAGVALPTRPAGAVLGLLVVAYLGWSVFGRRPGLGRGRWRVRRPSAAQASGQVALASLDWLITGTVLFFLLPPALHLAWAPFLRAFLVAQTLGVISHVPGGVGVFEAVLLASLGASAALAASLVMYRVIYYLLPLLLAAVVAGVAEAGRMGRDAARPVPVGLPSGG